MGRREKHRPRVEPRPDDDASAAPTGATPRTRRLARWSTLGLVIVLASGVAGWVFRNETGGQITVGDLPSLPDLSRQPERLRSHLTQADAAARTQPVSRQRVEALCLAYHADMFYEQADRCYQLLENAASSWQSIYYRALAQGEMGDAVAFLAGLERVTRQAPDFSPAWWRLGDAQFKAGRYDVAVDAWTRVQSLPEPPSITIPDAPPRVAVAPIRAYATLGLARVALVRGDPERARILLEEVTSSSPRFGPAHKLLGDAHAALGRADDAARAAAVANRSPGYDPYVDPTLLTLVAETRSATLLLQQAASADISTNGAWREYLVRRAIELDPDNSDAVYELATLLRAVQRYDEAIALFERYRGLVPDDVQVVSDIGRCLVGLGRYPDAERMLRQAVAVNDDATTHYDLALVLDRTGRTGEAITEYRRALERNPNHSSTLNNLAIAYVRQGRLDDAVRQFERLLAADPANVDAHTNLGVVRLSQGARALAARSFRAALELSPGHPVAKEGLRKAEP